MKAKECFCPDPKPNRIEYHLVGCPALQGVKPIPEMTPGEINQELCEKLNLLEWHDFCSDSGKVQLLREMYDKGEWFFIWNLEDLMIDECGLLAKVALEWLREKERWMKEKKE